MKGCFALILVPLIAGLIFGYFALSRHREQIESALNQRVAVVNESFPDIDISYDYLTARVTGRATTAELEEIQMMIDTMRQGNGRVDYQVEIVRKEPANIMIQREKNKITLRGTVDSEATKRDFVLTAGLSGVEIVNQIKVAEDVAPFPSFVPAIAAIPLLVSSAEDARLEADPEKVLVSGTVASEGLKKILSGMFTSAKWSDAKIINQLKARPPPKPVVVAAPPKPKPPVAKPRPKPPQLPFFSWRQNGRRITLEGIVPDRQTRNSLIETAKSIVGPEGTIQHDKLKIVANMRKPDWLNRFPGFAKSALPKIKNPDFRLGPDDSRFSATIVGQGAKETFCAAFTDINPPGLTMALNVLPEPKKPKPKPVIAKPVVSKPKPEPKPKPVEKIAPPPVQAPMPVEVTRRAPVRSQVQQPVARPAAAPVDDRPFVTGLDRIIDIPASGPNTYTGYGTGTVKKRYEVYFDTNEHYIRNSEKTTVASILAQARQGKGTIEIDGYADVRGDPAMNMYLSRQRADRIRDYLINNGISPTRIRSVTGHGERSGTYSKSRKTEVRIME